jgi:hypothetical protein
LQSTARQTARWSWPAAINKQPVLAQVAETQIGTPLRQQNLADALAFGVRGMGVILEQPGRPRPMFRNRGLSEWQRRRFLQGQTVITGLRTAPEGAAVYM